ncbi:MAG: hypothetical protein RIB59_12865, partial [Rhodospirillales bacterium]
MAEDKPAGPPEGSNGKPAAKKAPPAKDAAGKGTAANKKKKKGGKGKLIAIAAALAVVLIGGGTTAFFLLTGKKDQHVEVPLPPPPPEPGSMTTYDFPKILADLKTGQCRSNFLSARFMVEVGKNYTKDLQTKQPKIVEGMMLHLRSFE